MKELSLDMVGLKGTHTTSTEGKNKLKGLGITLMDQKIGFAWVRSNWAAVVVVHGGAQRWL